MTTTIDVSNGQLVSNEVINAGTILEVLSGGFAESATINSGGQLLVSGDVGNAVIGSGATETLAGGGIDSLGRVLAGGYQFVAIDASLLNETVAGGGTIEFEVGASLVGLTVSAGGVLIEDQFVLSGSRAFLTLSPIARTESFSDVGADGISSGVVQTNDALVLSGAVLIVQGPGTEAVNTVVSGAELAISSGGAATGTQVLSGGAFYILSNGVALATDVMSGGQQYIASGGQVAETTVGGGTQYVSAGGTTDGVTIGSGGRQWVSSGGSAVDVTVSSGGATYIEQGADVTDLTLLSGGGLIYLSATVSGAGVLATVSLPQSDLVLAEIGSGPVVSGADEYFAATISAGATVEVTSGGFAQLTQVHSGGHLSVLDSGGAALSEVDSGGTEFVSSKGRDLNVSVTAGGTLAFEVGASLSGTSLAAGAVLTEIGETLSGGQMLLAPSAGATFNIPASGTSRFVVSAISTTVDAGQLDVASGGVASDTMLVGGDAFVSAGGHAYSTTAGSRTSEFVLSGGVESDGTIGAGGTISVASGGALAGAITFAGSGVGSGAALVLGATSAGATISGFSLGDSIDVSALAYSAGGHAALDAVNHRVDVTDGASSFTLNIDATQDFTGEAFELAGDGGSGSELTLVTCFGAGTRMVTPGGAVAVERLRPGDLVLTADGAALPVRWLGVQTVSLRLADRIRVLPIRVRAGALGPSVPSRDLLLSPGHALLVDGLLIQAGALVNGSSIAPATGLPDAFAYYHVELAGHALLLAEGAPAESYLDGVEAVAFDNFAERPDAAPTAELGYPRVKSHRQVPASVRARLAARAAALSREPRAVAA